MRPALQAFFHAQRVIHLDLLVQAIRKENRDTMKEAHLAGQIDAYETALADLDLFAKEQMANQ